MQFLYAFLVGGAICVIGQLLMDVFKLTPAHMTVTLVVAGQCRRPGTLRTADRVCRRRGFGPRSQFWPLPGQRALAEAERTGLVGVLTGILK